MRATPRTHQRATAGAATAAGPLRLRQLQLLPPLARLGLLWLSQRPPGQLLRCRWMGRRQLHARQRQGWLLQHLVGSAAQARSQEPWLSQAKAMQTRGRSSHWLQPTLLLLPPQHWRHKHPDRACWWLPQLIV